MKHILIVTTIYRCGERMYPIIPKLSESYKLSLLTLYQMHRGGRYSGYIDDDIQINAASTTDIFDNETKSSLINFLRLRSSSFESLQLSILTAI